jgi:uncharacterized repeat protein (TIGR02543 family)
MNCALESVEFGPNVTYVPELFAGAKFASGTAVTIGGKITEVGTNAFYRATGLTTVEFIGTELKKIDDRAFFKSTDLTTAVLPSKLQFIGKSAFNGCTGITEVTIPESVTVIYPYAFNNSGVKRVVVNAPSINKDYDSDWHLTASTQFDNSFDNVNGTFMNCALESVEFGPNVTYVPELFAGAKFASGTAVTIGGKITEVGTNAFYRATGLTTVDFSGTLIKKIDDRAFCGCTDLAKADLPSKLQFIGKSAFYGCTELTEVVIPESVTEIYPYAFKNSGVKRVVVNPARLNAKYDSNWRLTASTSLGSGINYENLNASFMGCTLENLEFGPNVVVIPELFAGATFDSGSTLTFGGKITEIAKNAFYRVTGLKTVEYTGKVLSKINAGAFYKCEDLEKIVLGDNVTTIGNNAFYGVDSAYFYAKKGSKTETSLKKYGISADRIITMNGISYVLNGGIAGVQSPTNYSKIEGTVSISDPTREFYKFKGWYTDKAFKNLIAESVDGVTTIDVSNMNVNLTLYAKWEGPFYTVTFKPGVNGIVNPGTIEVLKGKTYGEYTGAAEAALPVATSEGKTFKGWYTIDGELITATTKVTDEAKNQVLYAKYKNNVDIVVDPELYTSNGEKLAAVEGEDLSATITDIDTLYLRTATSGADIVYTVKEIGSVEEVYEKTFADAISLKAGKTYTITAYATKEDWTTSSALTWRVKVEDSVSDDDTPALYTAAFADKFWVVINDAIYAENEVSTVFTGANVKISNYQVYYGKKLLEEGKDYSVSYKNNKAVAAYDAVNKKGASIAPTMIITGKGNTKGKIELRFSINLAKADAPKLTNSNTSFVLSETTFDYDGTEKKPTVQNLQVKATKKTSAIDINGGYTVSYQKNIEAGTATVYVTFDGTEYYGVLSKTFKINKVNIGKAIESGLVELDTAATRDEKVVYNKGYNGLYGIKNTVTNKELVLKTNYTVSNPSVNSRTMIATQTITGKGSFNGTYKYTYAVEKANIASAQVTSFVAPIASTKKGVFKPVAFKVYMGDLLLKSNEYSVSYSVDGQPATNKIVYTTDTEVVMTITGKGNYVGTKTYTYSPVAGYDLTDADLLSVSVTDAAYTGKANGVSPKIVIKNNYTNKNLRLKSDYVITYKYVNETEIKRTAKRTAVDYVAEAGEEVKAKDTVPAGTIVKAIITGKGAYDGNEIERVFRVGYDLSKASISIKNQTFTGKQIIPSKYDITVKVAGKVLDPQDYNVTLAGVDNVKVGTGKVLITGTNISSNSKVATFKIVSRALNMVERVLPVKYYTNKGKWNTVNVRMTMSTTAIQAGTVITLTGLPTDAQVAPKKLYGVDFKQQTGNPEDNEYYSASFGGETGNKYKSATVTFKAVNSNSIGIDFGSWTDGGMVVSYIIQTDGSLRTNNN